MRKDTIRQSAGKCGRHPSQQGALPPPLSQRTHLIAAAYRRGLGVTTITRALGWKNHQAVEHHLLMYQYYHGALPKAHSKRRSESVLLLKCIQCGAVFEAEPGRLKSRLGFCSPKCIGRHTRAFSMEDVETLIEFRQDGATWAELKKLTGRPHQTIQMSIWTYLIEHDRLTLPVVERIWLSVAGQARGGSWRWLENDTGYRPQEVFT
jgi:hypothetical protein